MTRLILALLLFAAALLAVASVGRFLASATRQPLPQEDPLPSAFRTVAFVLLMMLLVGVATGWLGAA